MLSHASWPGAVFQNRTTAQCALPVPPVLSPRTTGQRMWPRLASAKVILQASAGKRAKPVPTVRWPRAVSQPHTLSKSAILHRFPNFYTLRVKMFRIFLICSHLHMTSMNHEKFHVNQSAHFSKIQKTDTQTF